MTRITPFARIICLVLLSAAGVAWSHEGSLGTEMMWQACGSQKINDPCSFVNHDQDIYRGTCQAMSGALVCVRNQPIEHAAGLSGHADLHEQAPSAPRNAPPWWPWMAGSWALLVGGLAVLKVSRKTTA